MGSDHGCDYKGSRDDVHTGSGEGARWGQIMDATAKGPTTYSLEVERDGVISQMRLQGSRDDVPSGGGGRDKIMDATAMEQ